MLRDSGIPIKTSNTISNLYSNQLRKIQLAVGSLHEDLQYDYQVEIDDLNKF
jgi:hypothetical protein